MSGASLKMRNFAKRLIVFERRAGTAFETNLPPAFQVCEKLRANLGTFMGVTGFRELLSCALPRAQAEIPWLREVHLKVDGSLEGAQELSAKRNPDQLFEGGVVLVAQLLGLLAAIIGETLTLSIVREVWPGVPLDNLDFGTGGKDEEKE